MKQEKTLPLLDKSEKLVIELAQQEMTMNYAHNTLSGDAFLHLWKVARKLELRGLIEFADNENGQMFMRIS